MAGIEYEKIECLETLQPAVHRDPTRGGGNQPLVDGTSCTNRAHSTIEMATDQNDSTIEKTAQSVGNKDTSIFTSENWEAAEGILTSENSKPKRIFTSENLRPGKAALITFDQGKIKKAREFSLVKIQAGRSARGRKKKEDDLPDFGHYYYWKQSSKNGRSLEWRPPIRNTEGEIIDYDYEYIGFWHNDDWNRVQRTSDPEKIKEQIRTIIKAKRLIASHSRRPTGRTGAGNPKR